MRTLKEKRDDASKKAAVQRAEMDAWCARIEGVFSTEHGKEVLNHLCLRFGVPARLMESPDDERSPVAYILHAMKRARRSEKEPNPKIIIEL